MDTGILALGPCAHANAAQRSKLASNIVYKLEYVNMAKHAARLGG
jgi:hypothetical protein